MKGQIIKIIRDLHIVSCDDKHYECKCRGKIRNQKIVPLVGDYCIFDPQKKVIEEILSRKNEFERPPVSNIDQAIIVTSITQPDFSSNLLDRFLITMQLHHIESIICITKEDLETKETLAEIDKVLSYYQKIGYKIISNKNIEEIKQYLSGKTTVFTGQTGAGKSTLINKLYPKLNLEVGEISMALGRGKHTTRVISLFELNGGKVLDTPGFSSLDLYNFPKDDIKNSFIEFKTYPCPFKDCTHTKEKECSIKGAVKNKQILESRYENYLKFIERRN